MKNATRIHSVLREAMSMEVGAVAACRYLQEMAEVPVWADKGTVGVQPKPSRLVKRVVH